MKKFFESRQNLVAVLLGVFLCVAFSYQFVPFIVPLILASIFAFAFEPKIKLIRIKSSKSIPTALLLLFFVLAVMLPLAFAFYRLTSKVAELAKNGLENSQLFHIFEELKDKAIEFASAYIPGITDGFQGDAGTLGKMSSKVLAVTAGILGSTPDFVVALVVFLAATYFLIVYSKDVKESAVKLELLHKDKLERVIKAAQAICFGTILTSVVVGAVQALIVSLGALIFGYHETVLIFIVTFFVSFIPVIGAGPVAIMLALNCFLAGQNGAGIGLLVVSLIAGSIDNFIKPFLLSSTGSAEVKIHPIISILAFVGAVLVYGIPGLLIGPVLTQLAVALVPVLFQNVGMMPKVEPEKSKE
jgi:predicted PurR-regulated permease PerM